MLWFILGVDKDIPWNYSGFYDGLFLFKIDYFWKTSIIMWIRLKNT